MIQSLKLLSQKIDQSVLLIWEFLLSLWHHQKLVWGFFLAVCVLLLSQMNFHQ